MAQITDDVKNYADFFETKYKWTLTVGNVHGKGVSFGHIVIGLPKKMATVLDSMDFSELKWVIFDECDQIKDIEP